jgi:hypothetical protein
MPPNLDAPPPLPSARIPKALASALRRADYLAVTTGYAFVRRLAKTSGLENLSPEARASLGSALAGAKKPGSDAEWLAYTAAMQIRREVEDEGVVVGVRQAMPAEFVNVHDGVESLARSLHLAALEIEFAKEFGAEGHRLDDDARKYLEFAIQDRRARILRAPIKELEGTRRARTFPWVLGGAALAAIAASFRAC